AGDGRIALASDGQLKKSEVWDYAPAPEARDYLAIAPQYDHFIGGTWVRPKNGKRIASINPATEEVLAEVADGSAADVDRAVKSARVAYEKYWRGCPPATRAKYLYRIARAIT